MRWFYKICFCGQTSNLFKKKCWILEIKTLFSGDANIFNSGEKVVGLWNTSVLFPSCRYYTTKYGEFPRSTSKYEIVLCLRAKEKYRGMFEIQKSGDKTSSGEIGLDIRTHASPKVGHDQVSGGVSVLCWHAAPVVYVLWKPCTIR